MSWRQVGCAVLGLTALACGQRDFHGRAFIGHETFAFQECGSSAVWSLDTTGLQNAAGRELVDALIASRACPAPECVHRFYVEMTGRLSGTGSYGHLGRFEREVTPLEFHAASIDVPASCRLPTPRFPGP